MHPNAARVLPLDPSRLLINDKRFLNFACRDTLGLTQHAEIRKNAMKYILQYGLGPCHSDFIEGALECMKRVEEIVQESLESPCVRFYSSRRVALWLWLSSLCAKPTAVFCDQWTDPELLQAVHGSGLPVHRYRKADLDHLSELLAHSSSAQKVILVESLHYETGLATPLEAIATIACKAGARLAVDDSSAFGVKGKGGMGLARSKSGVDMILCGLNRGGGIDGALIAAQKGLNKACASQELSVSFPTLGAIEALFEILPQLDGERGQLEQRSHWLSKQLRAAGFCITPSSTHLLSVFCASASAGQKLYQQLFDQAILTERLLVDSECVVRFNVNAFHSVEDLNLVLTALETDLECVYENRLF